MKRVKWIVVLAFVALWLSGCASCPPVDPQHKLYQQFDDPMISLAKAVDVIADTLPSDAKDEVIFEEVVRRSNNPKLLEPFDGYKLKARLQDGTGIILLCSQDGKEGIIEDVTCTTRPDTFRPPGSPCEYLLDVKKVCLSR